jgi:DNA-binding transcriptional LysR family regulator
VADLNALVLFAKVVEAQSFSEAARRLAMPVSTVSRRVADLEAALGVRLLERTTRRLRLTPIGADIFAHARVGIDVSETVDGLVSERAATVSGTLRLSAPPSIADSLLAPLLAAFVARFPDVRIETFVTERVVDLAAEGVDVAIVVGAPRDPALAVEPITRYRHRLVASPAYVRRHGAPTEPSALHAHTIVAFSYWNNIWEWTFHHAGTGAAQTVPLVPRISMNDYAGLAALLVSGTAIGDLPPIVQPALLADGRLLEIMPDWHFPVYPLSLAYQRRTHGPRVIREFVTFASATVKALFPQLPV